MGFGYDNCGIFKEYDFTGKFINEYNLSSILDSTRVELMGVTMLKDSLIYQIFKEKIDYEDR